MMSSLHFVTMSTIAGKFYYVKCSFCCNDDNRLGFLVNICSEFDRRFVKSFYFC